MKAIITEEDLIKRCKKMDALAQKYLYDKYSAKFLGICKRYFNNLQEAEDTMIEAFMKIFEKLTQFRNEGSFEGWLKRIVVNQCLVKLRKKSMLFVSVEKHCNENLQPLEEIHSNLNVEDLLVCLQKLPDGYRTVFNLYAIEGYSHQEIAQMLGISEGTSKSQLSRARNMLQKFVSQIEQEQSPNFISI